MNYLSHSFRAQRLEGIGRTAMFNQVLDDMAAQPLSDFDGLHCFSQTDSVFSQQHKASFALSGIKYTSAEQYMMYGKALLFEDQETASKILETSDPKKQKQLGREVQNFNSTVWQDNARRIVYEGNCGKFMQNPNLRDELSATGNKLLVEAAPDDKIWGIGLAAEDAAAQDKAVWQGSNWLGYVLTLLREDMAAFAKTI